MTHITCRLTAKNRDHLRNPTLGSRVWATCTFTCIVNKVKKPERGVGRGVGKCLDGLHDPAVACRVRRCVSTRTGRLGAPRPGDRTVSDREKPVGRRDPVGRVAVRSLNDAQCPCCGTLPMHPTTPLIADTLVHPFRRAPRSYYTHSCSAAVICSRSLR